MSARYPCRCPERPDTQTRECCRRPRYLLATHDPRLSNNSDMPKTFFALPGGGWRPLNLCLPPFSLLKPLELFLDTGFALWSLPFDLDSDTRR